jgi:hypothetical protein
MKRRIDVSLNEKFSGKQAAGRRHKKTKNEKNKKKRKNRKKIEKKKLELKLIGAEVLCRGSCQMKNSSRNLFKQNSNRRLLR